MVGQREGETKRKLELSFYNSKVAYCYFLSYDYLLKQVKSNPHSVVGEWPLPLEKRRIKEFAGIKKKIPQPPTLLPGDHFHPPLSSPFCLTHRAVLLLVPPTSLLDLGISREYEGALDQTLGCERSLHQDLPQPCRQGSETRD